jgi:crotonobetainyl-CoA:carnitine CoA-transferase CaiB-like acyl-CoA transferase
MTAADWIAVAIPCATIALAVFATYAGPLGAYLAERTHNERWNAIAVAAGRIAADISQQLAAVPAGQSVALTKAMLISNAVTELKAVYGGPAGKIALTGATDPQLVALVSREVAKLPPKVLATVDAAVGVPAAPADAPPIVADAPPVAAPAAWTTTPLPTQYTFAPPSGAAAMSAGPAPSSPRPDALATLPIPVTTPGSPA